MTVPAGAKGLWLVAAAFACSSVAAQSNLLFLKDSPLARFNTDDLRLLQEAGQHVLDSQETAPSRAWRNDKTRHSGRVTLVQRFAFDGRDCGRLRVESSAAGMQSSTLLSACRNAAGSWALEPRARPPARR
jgi:surface antigen